jgi:hypothetical protein
VVTYYPLHTSVLEEVCTGSCRAEPRYISVTWAWGSILGGPHGRPPSLVRQVSTGNEQGTEGMEGERRLEGGGGKMNCVHSLGLPVSAPSTLLSTTLVAPLCALFIPADQACHRSCTSTPFSSDPLNFLLTALICSLASFSLVIVLNRAFSSKAMIRRLPHFSGSSSRNIYIRLQLCKMTDARASHINAEQGT